MVRRGAVTSGATTPSPRRTRAPASTDAHPAFATGPRPPRRDPGTRTPRHIESDTGAFPVMRVPKGGDHSPPRLLRIHSSLPCSAGPLRRRPIGRSSYRALIEPGRCPRFPRNRTDERSHGALEARWSHTRFRVTIDEEHSNTPTTDEDRRSDRTTRQAPFSRFRAGRQRHKVRVPASA